MIDLLEKIPDWIQIVLSITGGGAGTYFTIKRSMREGIKTQSDLLNEFERRYVESRVSYLDISKKESAKTRLIQELRVQCKKCYDEALARTGLQAKDLD